MTCIMQWNARSIVARKPELERFLSNRAKLPDVLCIQESHLHKNIKRFCIHGYTMERSDRDPGHGGGLLTMVKSGLSYSRLPNPTSLEALVIRVKLQTRSVTVVNVYHAPNVSFDETAYRRLIREYSQDAIILGDLNAYSPLFGANSTDTRGRALEDLIDENNLVVLNTGVGTYVRNDGSTSHLDVAMASNNIARVANWSVHCDTLGSDHLPVFINIQDPAVIDDTLLPHWAYKRANWDGFKADCQQLLTPDIIDDDVPTSCKRLVNVIISAAEANIPVVKTKPDPRHKYVPYWSDECSDAVKKRNKAKNRMQRTGVLADKKQYFHLRGRAQHIIKSAQKNYWQDYCSTLDHSSKLSKVWSTVKSMSGVRSRPTIPALTENNICYDTNSDKAEIFAQKFAAVSSDEKLPDEFKARRKDFDRHLASQSAADDGSGDTRVNQDHDDGINRAFEMHELLDAFKACKKKSTSGADRISYEILKRVPRSCQTVLLNFYNVIWNQGLLPSEWKDAIITPLLKPNKSPFDPASYRPVALTSTLCKIMERMVSTRLRWWMETNKLFSKFQSGFRKHRCTTDQILRLADEAHQAIHTKQCTLAIMLDLEKAFDLVWHRGLLYKMEKLGLKGNIVQFVADFLTNRTIRVRVGSSVSNPYPLQNGTPQGSVISPLLFLIMINDIDTPENNVQLSLFADDSAAWKSGRNVRTLSTDVQAYLDRLVSFFDRWGFKLSAEKTVAILFTRGKSARPDDVKLSIKGKLIKVEETVKFLGVIFDKSMSWKPYIQHIVDRCQKRLNLLRVMAGAHWGASKATLLIVYKALIRSVIDYGSEAYNTASMTTKAKLEVIQAKALRICCGAMIGTPTSALQVECGQPPLELRRKRMMADYGLKISCIPNHPTAETLTDKWTHHYGKFDKGREPFGTVVKEIMQKAQIRVIPSVPAAMCPWRYPAAPDQLSRLLISSKLKIKQKIIEQWQEMWDYSSTGDFYRGICPMVSYKLKFHTNPRAKDVQITRLRLGHVKSKNTLHTIGQATDPNCENCGVPEDIEHFLTECPRQGQLQHLLRQSCRCHHLKFSMKTLLKEACCIDIIYDYLTANNTRI